MKYNRLKKILLLLIVISTLSLIHAEKFIQLKGVIDTLQDINGIPEFVIKFQGKQTISQKDGTFSFIVDKNSQSRIDGLLICEKTSIKRKKNKKQKKRTHTLKNIYIADSVPYKFFKLEFNEDLGTQQWDERDLPKNKKNKFKVPANTIIIEMNPEIVNKVESLPIGISSNYISGPIIFLDSIDKEHLNHESSKTLAKSIDDSQYFEKNRMVSVPSSLPKTKITIPNSN